MSRSATAGRSGASYATLPAALRFLLAGDLVTAVGIGLTQPYLVILLHTGKGMSLVAATATTSLLAVASFPGNCLSGALIDRVGGRHTMVLGLVCAMAGLAAVAAGEGVLALAFAVALVGFGWSVTLPAYATAIADLVPEADRSRAFTIQYALFNAGMGTGAAGGALLVEGVVGAGLAPLWWVAATTCAVAVATVRLSLRSSPVDGSVVGEPRSGYRTAFADRALVRVLLAAALCSAAGYGVYNAGLPVLAVSAGQPSVMPWVGVANCLTVVMGLPFALRLADGRTPERLLTATAAVWSIGWLLCVAQAATPLLDARVTLPLVAVLTGLGELCMAGALPAIVNTLAPAALRGRYNAALTLAMTAGMSAGPLLAAGAAAVGRISLLFAAAVVLLAAMAGLVRRRDTTRSEVR